MGLARTVVSADPNPRFALFFSCERVNKRVNAVQNTFCKNVFFGFLQDGCRVAFVHDYRRIDGAGYRFEIEIF